MQYSHSYSWDKPIKLPGQTDFCPPPHTQKTYKQGTEKEYAAEGVGFSEHTRERERRKDLISTRTFSKQRLEKQKD
jgi:hypothetical protein